ncbi:MAG TPA: hypothetical protein VK034_21240 [Enhygromyxa sp.]|nr:hypothetical protein [Enhygromyxa sp.]
MRVWLLLTTLTLAVGCGGRGSKSRSYQPQDPHEFGVSAPYLAFTEADQLDAALAALAAEGLDISAAADASFSEGASLAILVGVPLRERPDGSFAIVDDPPTWSWQQQTTLAELQLLVGVGQWSWSAGGVKTLVVGPWTESYVEVPCEGSSGSLEPEGVYYQAAPAGLFDVQPTLYLLPKIEERIEVLYLVQRQHMIGHHTDCFMSSRQLDSSRL